MQQSLLHQPSKLFCVFCVFRGNICSPTDFTEFTEQTGRDVLPQNSQNSQNRLAEDVLPQISQMHTDVVFLEFCEFCVFCGTSHAPVNLCKSVQSVGGSFSTLLQNRLAEDVLLQISLILTDGVCLEFCVFCVFRGTSYAPSGSVKICAICGRIISVAWVIALLVPSALLVHFLLWQAAKPSGDKCTPYSATKRLGFTPRSR